MSGSGTIMPLDIAEVTKEMMSAARAVLAGKWPKVRVYAEAEFKKLAETFVMIAKLRESGQITPDEARLHLELQRNAARAVMLTIKGLGLLTVEEAINAALAVVKKTVNTALGFALI